MILARSPGGILARGQSYCKGLDRCIQIPHVVLPGAALGVFRGAAWGRRLEYIPVTQGTIRMLVKVGLPSSYFVTFERGRGQG